jgi:hypothetical protein
MTDAEPQQQPRQSDLLVRALDLRIARIESERDVLRVQVPTSEDERAELESRRNQTLYDLEIEGARIERDFVTSFRGRLIDILGGSAAGGGLEVGPALPTCHLACQICVTSCTLCVTSCTYCITSCPQCVTSCTNSVF